MGLKVRIRDCAGKTFNGALKVLLVAQVLHKRVFDRIPSLQALVERV